MFGLTEINIANPEKESSAFNLPVDMTNHVSNFHNWLFSFSVPPPCWDDATAEFLLLLCLGLPACVVASSSSSSKATSSRHLCAASSALAPADSARSSPRRSAHCHRIHLQRQFLLGGNLYELHGNLFGSGRTNILITRSTTTTINSVGNIF
jgi:hypothetical protein